MAASRIARSAIAVAFLTLAVVTTRRAGAEGVPPPVELPQQVSLDQALHFIRTRSLDLLILPKRPSRTRKVTRRWQGRYPILAINGGYGRLPNYDPKTVCMGNAAGCSADTYTAGISDQALIEDSLSGKRDLRLQVAHAALKAARLSRTYALRTIEFQTKAAYAQVALAQRSVAFAKEVQATNVKTLELFQIKLKSGSINDGDLARIETQKLEADQAVDAAVQTLEPDRFALGFLRGVRGPVAVFWVDYHVLDFAVPAGLASADADHLLRTAFDHRPDLLAQGFQAKSAESAITLAKRQVFPDISVSAQYSQTGTNTFDRRLAAELALHALGADPDLLPAARRDP